MEVQLPVFPAEIFILIIDVLGKDLAPYTSVDKHYWELRHTLLSLATTCRVFHGQSTRHLFHTLLLWGEPDDSYDRYVRKFRSLADTLADPGGPALYVRTVAITFFSGLESDWEDEEEPAEEADYFTARWFVHFQEVLPGILNPLSNIRHLLLVSEMIEPPLSFALLTRPTRAAILQCIRLNPLESLVVHRLAIPWELLLALPASLQSLELGDAKLPLLLEKGESGRVWLKGSADYTADSSMFRRRAETALKITPATLRLGISSIFSFILARQPAVFGHVQVLDFRIRWEEDFLDLSDMLSHGSTSLKEIVIRLQDVTAEDYQLLLDSIPEYLQAVKPLPILANLCFVYCLSDWFRHIACPSFLPAVVDCYLSHPAFTQIKTLQVAGTWHFDDNTPLKDLQQRQLLDRSASSWGALDIRLADLPAVDSVELALTAEDHSSIPEPIRRQIAVETEAEVTKLFPRSKARDINVVVYCHTHLASSFSA
ncbi:hypothetical protein BKA70DRAFT_361622 [Coprinopsis sp. MPI-PUGE-AT-0042]|nr:hypothetical protein BKA70DRAFT_361622 [Coprinopsis sp. MPI-PUGE-AT-0042]